MKPTEPPRGARARSCSSSERGSERRDEQRTPILSESGLSIGRYDTKGCGFTTVTAPGYHAVIQIEGLYVDRTGGGRRVVPSGSLAFFRPEHVYTTGDDVGGPATAVVFSLADDLLQGGEFRRLSSMLKDPDGPALIHLDPSIAVRARVALLAASSASSFLESQELAMEVDDLLAQRSTRRRSAVDRRTPSTVRAHRELTESIVEVISRDPSRAWSLDQIAACTHSSPFHMSRVVRSVTGRSVGELLVRCRVLRAATLLEQTDWSTDLIALHCGYSHRGRLGVVFRSAAGQSMAEYRRQCRAITSRARISMP